VCDDEIITTIDNREYYSDNSNWRGDDESYPH